MKVDEFISFTDTFLTFIILMAFLKIFLGSY